MVVSGSGHTARLVSAARPAAPAIAVSADPAACRRMNLLWGVVPSAVAAGDLADVHGLARRLVRDLGVAQPGDIVLAVRGFHRDPEHAAPSVTVVTV